MKKTGIGVIGSGKARFLFGRAINASAHGRLAGLAAATQEEADAVGARLNARQRTGDWKKLLANPDIDAVFVSSPTHLHAEMTISAAERVGRASASGIVSTNLYPSGTMSVPVAAFGFPRKPKASSTKDATRSGWSIWRCCRKSAGARP